MNGHLRFMRNPAQIAAKASQGMWVSVTKSYDLNAEIPGHFIYHTNGVGVTFTWPQKGTYIFFLCSALKFKVFFFKLAQKHQEDIHSCSFMAFICQAQART